MGKRKSRKIVRKAPIPKLDKEFNCPFCDHTKCVEVQLDRQRKIGTLACRICTTSFSTHITSLDEAVDVYATWIDRAKEANDEEKQQINYDDDKKDDDEEEYLQSAEGDEYNEDRTDTINNYDDDYDNDNNNKIDEQEDYSNDEEDGLFGSKSPTTHTTNKTESHSSKRLRKTQDKDEDEDESFTQKSIQPEPPVPEVRKRLHRVAYDDSDNEDITFSTQANSEYTNQSNNQLPPTQLFPDAPDDHSSPEGVSKDYYNSPTQVQSDERDYDDQLQSYNQGYDRAELSVNGVHKRNTFDSTLNHKSEQYNNYDESLFSDSEEPAPSDHNQPIQYQSDEEDDNQLFEYESNNQSPQDNTHNNNEDDDEPYLPYTQQQQYTNLFYQPHDTQSQDIFTQED